MYSTRYPLLIFALLLTFAGSDVYAQETAKGTVFLDKNGNSQLDDGEKGIAGVAVSNGRDVVLTNQKGAYSLEIDEKDGKVFVIKPSGYHLPVDSLNRVQFYYLHKPHGSPDLKYEGVAPTGELPESVNFPLIKGEKKDSYKVLLFGDPQPYNRKEVDYFDRDVVSELRQTDAYRFGITLGDLVGDDLDLFTPYSKSVAKIGVPWYNVYGNHDMNFDAEHDKHADETFEAHFGPATFSFNSGKTHFIVLDDVIYPRKDGKSGYIGGFTDKQLEYVKNDLKHVPKNHLIVLAFHIPPHTENKWRRTFRREDRDRLFELLEDYPHTLSLSAHTHTQNIHFFGQESGWGQPKPHIHYNVGTTSGDWWSGVPDKRNIPPTLMRDGTPNGYGILNIDGNSFNFGYKVADRSEDYKMSIWGPKVVKQRNWPDSELYVNYFLGSKYTDVYFRIKGKAEWRSMRKVEMEDPHVAQLRQKWDTSEKALDGKRPSNPVKSSHLWKARVPDHLSIGRHTLEIKVQDMFGRTFTDEYSYEIVESD